MARNMRQHIAMTVGFVYLRVRNKRRSPKYNHIIPHMSGCKLMSECTEYGASVKNAAI